MSIARAAHHANDYKEIQNSAPASDAGNDQDL